jgi:hypothetical protein
MPPAAFPGTCNAVDMPSYGKRKGSGSVGLFGPTGPDKFSPGVERTAGGVTIGSHFYPWSYLRATPDEQVAALERKAARQAEKQAREQGREKAAQELTESTSEPADAKAPRWMNVGRGYTWHTFDGEKGGFVDTGLRPGPRGVGYPPEEAV